MGESWSLRVFRMRLDALREECKKISSELARSRPLSEKQVAAYLNRFSRLFFEASKSVKSGEEALEASKAIGLSMGWLYGRAKSKKLRELFGKGHGPGEVSTKPFMLFPGLEKSRSLLRYSGFHWAGIAHTLDGSINFPTGSDPRLGLTVLPDGNLRLSEGLLSNIILHTPHYVMAGIKNAFTHEIIGQAELTPRELFLIMRTVSNCQHSLAFNKALFSFRDKFDAGAVSRFEHACPDEQSRILRRKGVGIGERGLLLGLVRDGLFSSTLPHAHGSSSLSIRFVPNGAVVEDIGLGKAYADVAGRRFLGGTSGFLQRRVARITRRFGKGRAVTILAFKRPR